MCVLRDCRRGAGGGGGWRRRGVGVRVIYTIMLYMTKKRTTTNKPQKKHNSTELLTYYVTKTADVIFLYFVVLIDTISSVCSYILFSIFNFFWEILSKIAHIFEITIYNIFIKPIWKLLKVVLGDVVYKSLYSLKDFSREIWVTFLQNDIYKYLLVFFTYITVVVYFAHSKLGGAAPPATAEEESAVKTGILNLLGYLNIFKLISALGSILYKLIYAIMEGFANIDKTDQPEKYTGWGKNAKRAWDVFNSLPNKTGWGKDGKLATFVIGLYHLIAVYFVNFATTIYERFVTTKPTEPIAALQWITNIMTYISGAITEHFNMVKFMDILSIIYTIFSSFAFIIFLCYIYFQHDNKNMYSVLGGVYLLFMLPTIYRLITYKTNIINGFMLMALSTVTILLMYITHNFMKTNDKFNTTPDQQRYKTMYDTLFIIYSAFLVFFVNIRTLSSKFVEGDMRIFIMAQYSFLIVLLCYSVYFQVNLRNRINKSAVTDITTPPTTTTIPLDIPVYIR
jgi:hypothetical protein